MNSWQKKTYMKFFKNIFFLFSLLVTFISNGQIAVTNLTCNSATNPLAISTNEPSFSWQLVSKKFNVSQVEYQILVASSEEKLNEKEADLWNSGKVTANSSQRIAYKGKNLKNEKRFVAQGSGDGNGEARRRASTC